MCVCVSLYLCVCVCLQHAARSVWNVTSYMTVELLTNCVWSIFAKHHESMAHEDLSTHSFHSSTAPSIGSLHCKLYCPWTSRASMYTPVRPFPPTSAACLSFGSNNRSIIIDTHGQYTIYSSRNILTSRDCSSQVVWLLVKRQQITMSRVTHSVTSFSIIIPTWRTLSQSFLRTIQHFLGAVKGLYIMQTKM